jgi:hypothetical protein
MAATATLSLVAATAVGIAMAPAASAAANAITLSSVSGKSGGGNALTATTLTANSFYSGLAATFQYKGAAGLATCSPAYPASLTALATGVGMLAVASPQILSPKKIAFTVPALTLVPAGTATSAIYNLCVYSSTNTTTGLLTANAAYTVAAAPTIATITGSSSTSGVWPVSGPAQGGGTVTITGTGFTGTTTASTTTAKIGSVPLTNVVWVDAQHLTGTVPAQSAANNLSVSVTNTGGTVTRTGAFSYTNGITVSPNTTPTAIVATDVDVQGVGFSAITFTTTNGTGPDTAGGHVYLVDGAYDGTGGTKGQGELGECLSVLVISDSELICTVNTAKAYGQVADSAIADGTYTLTVVSNGLPDIGAAGANEDLAATQSIVSSGSTFTVAAY